MRPRKAQAPDGKGLRIRPAIVEMKMESNCHALGVICGGLGIKNWRIRPIEIENMKGRVLAPWGFDSVGEGALGDEDEVAWRGLRGLWRKWEVREGVFDRTV